MRTVSLTALRRITIEAQGYATRSRAGTAAEVEAAIRRLSCVQLDSISAVERSHRIALTSRVGTYKAGTVGRIVFSASRTDTFLGARYRRLARRRGKPKAIVAVGIRC